MAADPLTALRQQIERWSTYMRCGDWAHCSHEWEQSNVVIDTAPETYHRSCTQCGLVEEQRGDRGWSFDVWANLSTLRSMTAEAALALRSQTADNRIETLESMLALKTTTIQGFKKVQQRIAEILDDVPPAESYDTTLPSLVRFVVEERDQLRAALALRAQTAAPLIARFDDWLSRFHATEETNALLRDVRNALAALREPPARPAIPEGTFACPKCGKDTPHHHEHLPLAAKLRCKHKTRMPFDCITHSDGKIITRQQIQDGIMILRGEGT